MRYDEDSDGVGRCQVDLEAAFGQSLDAMSRHERNQLAIRRYRRESTSDYRLYARFGCGRDQPDIRKDLLTQLFFEATSAQEAAAQAKPNVLECQYGAFLDSASPAELDELAMDAIGGTFEQELYRRARVRGLKVPLSLRHRFLRVIQRRSAAKPATQKRQTVPHLL